MVSQLSLPTQPCKHGDQGWDRALLARLTTKGIDVAGKPPLFPCLDGLCVLLDEAGEENLDSTNRIAQD